VTNLTVGIIGCGRMGRERARCAHASDVRVVGVYDADSQRAALLAAQYDASVVESPEDLFECDAVFLCTPPDARPDQALGAVRAGVPFFAEKPLAVDRQAAEQVLRELERTPVINAVGYMNRYRASVQQARATLAGRRILGMTAHWVNRAYGVPWWLDERSSGGPHNEQATHLYDLARYLCGEIDDVSSLCAVSGDDDSPPLGVATSLRFASGALGTILYSCEAAAKDIGMRVFTSEGSVALATWDFALVENTIDGVVPELRTDDVYLLETRGFLDAVRSGSANTIRSDWSDAFHTQRIVDAAYMSARHGVRA
jgi:myo-inositol 2-dehydrogenase/D-chiro-inositol 1-dehydrogenase